MVYYIWKGIFSIISQELYTVEDTKFGPYVAWVMRKFLYRNFCLLVDRKVAPGTYLFSLSAYKLTRRQVTKNVCSEYES